MEHQTESKDGRRHREGERARESVTVGRKDTADLGQNAHSLTRGQKEEHNKEREDQWENATIGRTDTVDSEQAANTHTRKGEAVTDKRNQDISESEEKENTTERQLETPENDTASPSIDKTRDMAKETRKGKEWEKEKEKETGAIVEEEDIAQEEEENREDIERSAATTENQTRNNSKKGKAAKTNFPKR